MWDAASNKAHASKLGCRCHESSACRPPAMATLHFDHAIIAPCAILLSAGVVTRRRAAKQRSGSVTLLATRASSAQTEIQRLERDAQCLRAEVAQLEAEQAEHRLSEKKTWFKLFQADGSGGVDVKGLQRGMLELNGSVLDEGTALQILEAHDADKDGLLQFDEFDIRCLEDTLARIQAEEREQEIIARLAAREELERQEELEELQKDIEEYEEMLPPQSFYNGKLFQVLHVVRLGSAMVYLVPLLDWIRSVAPLLEVSQSDTIGALQLLTESMRYGEALTGAHLVVFLAMGVLSRSVEVPSLLRFHTRQALLLDLVAWLFTYSFASLAKLITVAAEGSIFVEVLDVTLYCYAVLLAATLAWAALCSLRGETLPSRIPVISEIANRSDTLDDKETERFG